MSDELELTGKLFRSPPPGTPQTVGSDPSEPVDLSDLLQEVERAGTEAPPPKLIDGPSLLWPAHSGLHSSLLATASSPIGSAEAWQSLVEELAEESRQSSDDRLRGAMLCEAGRLLIDRLGRQEEGELLLRKSESPIAEQLKADPETGVSSLAGELAGLEATARDATHPPETRAAAWIEFGLLCEERTPSRKRAFDAYVKALKTVPNHPVALGLLVDVAVFLEDGKAAKAHLRQQLEHTESSRLRAALLLELAEHLDKPKERQAVLEEAHKAEPQEETALRRLSRAVSAKQDPEYLAQLYRELAQVAEDPISASTAAHLAFLTLADAGRPVDELVVDLASRAPDGGDSDLLAPLAEVALHVEQRISTDRRSDGVRADAAILDRLSASLDDPREQALVREQVARLRLGELRRKDSDATAEDRQAISDRLEADLRFCLVHLPEHRWVSEALAELLEMREDLHGLTLHLQEWARTESAGPGRAAILLRLGEVHEGKRKDLARAAEIYELAVAEDTDNPNCLRALGRIYEKMRRWPQAAANLQRQAGETDDEPERLAALRRLAVMAEHELRDVDLAIATLEEIAKMDPDDLLSLFQLAALSRSNNRPAVLMAALQALVNRIDDDVARTSLLVELGEVQELHLKQRTTARDCYERALALTPGYTPALRALARLYRDTGDLDALAALLGPDVDPVSDPAVLALKAGRVSFEEIGDIDRAIEFLRKAYETNPDLAPARELLLQLMTASGKIQDAYDLLRAQDLPSSEPLLADYHYRLGLLAEALARQAGRRPGQPAQIQKAGHEDSALQHYRAALALQPDHGLAFERSRRLLVAHHDRQNLVRLMEGVLTDTDDDGRAVLLVHLARLHVGGEEIDHAHRVYEEAHQLSPDDPITRREFEGLLRQVDDRQSLPALYLRAARQTTDTHLKATLLVEAAELLLTTGAAEDHDLAGNAILEALREDPGNPYAVRHLERLLSEPGSTFVIKDAVSARAVRAQSDAERAIFYVESAELLERAGAWDQARRAYLAAQGAMGHLAPADLGLARTASGSRRATTATQGKTSIHVLVAEARDAAVRSGTGDAAARSKALKLISEILARDPQHRDAIALARALAGQLGDATPVLNLLRNAFARMKDDDLRYELGLFLGENSARLEDAVRFYQAAADAKSDGRRALRGLVNTFRQMGDDRRAAEATEQLLELFDPGEPSAIDLRMGIASFLGSSPETLPRALDHAKVVLEARTDDPRAIILMADLLERSKQPREAAGLLDRLIARERDRDRLHDIYLRKAKLLSTVSGASAQALDAIERAAAINPGNRETITLLVDQLNRGGQSARVGSYLQPIRTALTANIGRGAVSLRDLALLATVAEKASPRVAEMAGVLLYAIEPSSTQPPRGHLRPATAAGLRRVMDTPSLRHALYAAAEPPHLHDLLQTVESIVGRLGREFPMVDAADSAPMPPGIDLSGLLGAIRPWAEACGIVRPPQVGACSTHNAVALLQEPSPLIRFGQNLWMQGDETAWRGLVGIALGRSAFGAARARALSPIELDLLLAACFESVEVFNPITADPDPRRLRDVTGQLIKMMPRRARKSVERSCQALASHAFDPSTTARTTLATDLHIAALITGDMGGCIAAACLLDGVVGGSLKQRINRSRAAQELLIHVLGDNFLTLRSTATG